MTVPSRPGLSPIFSPRSVAVIGASRNPTSIGHTVLINLLRSGFQGPVYPVNPHAEHVASVRCYPDVQSIPGPVDLAVILVPAAAALPVIEACGAAGVRGLIVISAGFSEIGAGQQREEQLKRRVQELGMRLIGPNCLGVLSTDPSVRLNATFAPTVPPEGNVAFSTQSGALGVAILDTAHRLGLGISEFASVGNKADVSGNDLLEHWEDDARTEVILLYLESFGNPRHFAEIAARVSRKKPIVAVKSGRTAGGARAASSHTGALADAERTVAALFERTGVVRVDTVEELFDTAMVLANQPLPPGQRVAIVSNAGGPGVLCTDACLAGGLELAELAPSTRKTLAAALPAEASTANPVDMIAGADATAMEACLDAVLADPGVDAAIALYVPPGNGDAEAVAGGIVSASDRAPDKPVLSCFMGTHGVPEALRSLEAGSVPSYRFPEAAARALARVSWYSAWRRQPTEASPVLDNIDTIRATALLEASSIPLTAPGSTTEAQAWLEPDVVRDLLDCYGISQPQSRYVGSASEARSAAAQIGFPVVVKADVVDMVHKSDEGGVALDLVDANAVDSALNRMEAAFGPRLRGFLIQQMAPGGLEVLVGGLNDPRVGPLVMYGMGGINVELLDDVAVALAPLSNRDADRLMDSVKAAQLMAGHRGRPAGDAAAVRDVIQRVARMLCDHPRIVSLDLNPVLAQPPGLGAVAVDGRVLVG
ncbi:MAG: acetyl coenzyme A synthetase (ADP forming)-like protein [Myxococcota bacterium]|jgi:acetyl coenzyme A synthetase (ADP forming)-like protein